MSKVKIQGNASGTGVITLTAPNTSTDRTVTLPDADVTLGTDATKLPLAGGTMTGNIAHAGDFTIDVGGDLILDADGADVRMLDGGTDYIKFTKDGNNSAIKAQVSDGDLIFRGSDNGAQIDALTLDMSDAGKAVFNNGVALGGSGAANTLDDYEEGTWTPSLSDSGNRSGTWSNTIGIYTKIGNIVHLYFGITGSAMYFTSERGYQYITGIPFNAANPTHYNTYSGTWSGDAVDKSAGGHVYLNGSGLYMHSANSNPSTVGVSGIGCHIAYRTNS
jgi:hypothetical protein